MNAEILCVGTELLLGDVVNTNAADIARELARLGINVYHHAVVGDNPQRLKECLEESFSRCELVVMTGGLGPTYDDLTKETAAAYFGRSLVMDQAALRQLESYFIKTGRTMTENNRKQAMMPQGCIVLDNPNGTAPGCIIEQDGRAAILMPGPPREMKPMLEGPVRDYLERRSDCTLVSRVLNLFGVGESAAESILRKLMIDSLNPTVAPYAKPGEVQLRITARAKDSQTALCMIEPVAKIIYDTFGENIYGEGYKDIAQGAYDILSKNGLTLATAESCTGGLVSSRMVDNPGSSAVLLGAVVAYSNEVKQKVLGVSEDTLKNYGAVSSQCALEMARGVRQLTGADIAVSTTGVAGPDGGSKDKPVGLVYVACVSQKGEEVRELMLARGRRDDRESIRLSASSNAFDMAIRMARR